MACHLPGALLTAPPWAWGLNMESGGHVRSVTLSAVVSGRQIGLVQNRGGRKAALLCLLAHPLLLCAPTTWGRDCRRGGGCEDSGKPHGPGGSGEGVEEMPEAAVLT